MTVTFNWGGKKPEGVVADPNKPPFSLISFLDGYKAYLMVAASVAYGVGIDYQWWPHSLTLDALLGGGTLAAFRSAMKGGNAMVVKAIVDPTSPIVQKIAASVPPEKG